LQRGFLVQFSGALLLGVSSACLFGTLRVMQNARGCAIQSSVDPNDPTGSVASACPPSPSTADAANLSVLELKRSLEAVHEVERSIAHNRRRMAVAAITLFVVVVVIFVRAVVVRA